MSGFSTDRDVWCSGEWNLFCQLKKGREEGSTGVSGMQYVHAGSLHN